MVIWICGLSGSGKTALGRLLFARLKPRFANLVLLDGDDFRAALGGEIGYDKDSRDKNSVRIGNMCRLLDGQGIHVICCAVTLSEEVRASNREHLSAYCEVFLDVSLEVLRKRDRKDIYGRAERGEMANVAGIDVPYAPPPNPTLVIDNNRDREDLTPLVERILERAGFPAVTA